MNSKNSSGGRQRSSTGEYLSPWSSNQYWSFNPKNISVVSPVSREDQYRTLDLSLNNGAGKKAVKLHLSGIQMATIGLLVACLGIVTVIVYSLLG